MDFVELVVELRSRAGCASVEELVDLVVLVTELCACAGCASVMEFVDLVEVVVELCSWAGCASVVVLVVVTELRSSAVWAVRFADGEAIISARRAIKNTIDEYVCLIISFYSFLGSCEFLGHWDFPMMVSG